MRIALIVIASLLVFVRSESLYSCIENTFTTSCKSQLYACTNDPECSYQLHENTKHIFLDQNSIDFPTLYFSNQKARDLYSCIKSQCNLPEIDESYPKQLPFDSCLIEIYDLCRGNIEEVFSNPSSQSPEALCYRKYCTFPSLSNA